MTCDKAKRYITQPNRLALLSFLCAGLAVQIITYVLTPTTPLSLISGMLGICAVVLGSQGNILTFFFGFGQIVTYTCLCYFERFYAGIAMNIFYFVTQIYGIYSWRKRLMYRAPTDSMYNSAPRKSRTIIYTRRLSVKTFLLLSLIVIILSLFVGWLLSTYTDDTQPYLDAFTTVPAIAAQILMILAYREQWYIWLFIDLLYVVLWLRAEDYCLTAQYLFWCINCVYGYVQWTKNIPRNE